MGIKELFLKLAEYKDFAAKYQTFSSLDDALEEAKKDGYSITKEEALAVLQTKSGELTDEELASVAGGKENTAVEWGSVGKTAIKVGDKVLPITLSLL